MPNQEQVLITGGAGFIGSHLADAIAQAGHRVTLFDNLDPQVHHHLISGRPAYLCKEHELIVGDVRDAEALAGPLRSSDVVFHFASRVGVGQSMYEVKHYTENNVLGTANLLQVLVDNIGKIRKLIVASSMSVYGEGTGICSTCGIVAPRLRSLEQLAMRDWEPRCPKCAQVAHPLPTTENKPLQPMSIYAITKRDQEEMVLAFGLAYQIPVVVLRFFNAYGPRQSLCNPYTGVMAIFMARMLSGQAPVIFEDGWQVRDFVHVSDIVQACLLAMSYSEADYGVFNVGSQWPTTILEVAEVLASEVGWTNGVDVKQAFRAGDIRYCFPDIQHIRSRLGYTPKVGIADGIGDLVRWASTQEHMDDQADEVVQRLVAHRLLV